MIYHEQVLLEEGTYNFYRKIAETTGRRLEQVLSDALFRLAGELSMEAMGETERQALYEKHGQ